MRRRALAFNAIGIDYGVRIFSEAGCLQDFRREPCKKRNAKSRHTRMRHFESNRDRARVNLSLARRRLHECVSDEFSDAPASRRAFDGLLKERFGLGLKRIEQYTQRSLLGVELFAIQIGNMTGIFADILSQHGITRIVAHIGQCANQESSSGIGAISGGTCLKFYEMRALTYYFAFPGGSITGIFAPVSGGGT